MSTPAACPYCGAAGRFGDVLCTACGRNRVELRCDRCQFVNPVGVRFCGDCGARLADQLVAGSDRELEAERRQLTVLFCDLVDSVGLSRHFDPEDYRELLQHYRDACTRVFHRYEGTQIRYVGDGIRVYFGYPRAHEDDAERAVRAALEVAIEIESLNRQDGETWTGRLAVRIGIATGLVVAGWLDAEGRHESEAVGETPNLAARLQGLAQPGAVVVGDATKRLLGRLFEFRDLGSHTLKGFSEPVQVWRALESQALDSRFEATRSPDAPLVGRSAELARLQQNWDLARAGQGRVVLLSGEAGVGKSRLVRALRERLTTHHRLLYQCSPYHRNSVLYPVITQLEYAAGMRANDSAAQRLDKLTGLIRRSNASPEALLPVLATLLSIPAGGLYTPPQLSAQRLKDRTFAALIELMLGLAADKPLLLVFEDLHWIDPTSEELLGRAIEAMRQAPVLMLFTQRPDYQAPWQDLAHVEPMVLARLDADQIRALVERLVGSRRLPRAILDQLVVRSDGIPLFTEELTRTMLEQPGRMETANEIQRLQVPVSLKDSLMARLDQLGEAKSVAQLGAAIGRSFSFELLAAVTSLPAQVLRDALGQLEAANLIQKRAANGEGGYIFRHALLQEAANDSLLHSRRRRMHLRIAEVMERDFEAQWTPRPEILARYYSEAGIAHKAAEYWLRAGRLASERSASLEAMNHLNAGLAALVKLPDAISHRRLELDLQTALGAVLINLKGAGSKAAEQAYSRAQELCLQLGDSADAGTQAQSFATLWGLWRTCADLHIAIEIGDRLLALAQQTDAPGLLLQAHHAQWTTLFCLGEHGAGHRHIEAGLACYDPQAHRQHATLYGGHDPAVCGLGIGALVNWLMGNAGQALEKTRRSLALARTLAHAGSMAHAMDLALIHSMFRRDAKAVHEQAEALIHFADEHSFSDYRARGMVFRGWSVVQLGEMHAGIEQMLAGIEAERETGTEESTNYFLEMLATAYGLIGKPEQGLEVLEDAFVLEKQGICDWSAEVRRRKGELLLLTGADTATAEAWFRDALKIAHQQTAKALVLRAAMSLSRLCLTRGDAIVAHDLLAPLHAGLAESGDETDLQEARALLDGLE